MTYFAPTYFTKWFYPIGYFGAYDAIAAVLAATEAQDTAALFAQAVPQQEIIHSAGGGFRPFEESLRPVIMTLRATEAQDRASGAVLVGARRAVPVQMAAKESPDRVSIELMEDFTDDELIMLLAA